MKIILLIFANIAITIIMMGIVEMIKDDDNGKEALFLKSLSVILGVGVIILWILLLWKKVL